MQPEQKKTWLTRLRQSTAERNQQRLARSQQPPWIWKIVPEKWGKVAGIILNCLGIFSLFIFLMAAMWGIVFAPLAIAAGHRGSTLENTMRWYVHLFPKDSDGFAYVFTQTCILGVLSYFVGVAYWLNKQKRDKNSQLEKPRSAETP